MSSKEKQPGAKASHVIVRSKTVAEMPLLKLVECKHVLTNDEILHWEYLSIICDGQLRPKPRGGMLY